MQVQLSRRAEAKPAPPSEHSFNGPSAFTDFIRAREVACEEDNLMSQCQPSRMPPTNPPPHQREQKASEQHFVPPESHGLKVTKPRDLDWLGFATFSEKET